MTEQILQVSLDLRRAAATNTRKDAVAGQEDSSIACLLSL